MVRPSMSCAIPRAASSNWSESRTPRTAVNAGGWPGPPKSRADETGLDQFLLKRAVGARERRDALPDFLETRHLDEVSFDNLAFIVQQIARISLELKIGDVQLLQRANLRPEHGAAAMTLV